MLDPSPIAKRIYSGLFYLQIRIRFSAKILQKVRGACQGMDGTPSAERRALLCTICPLAEQCSALQARESTARRCRHAPCQLKLPSLALRHPSHIVRPVMTNDGATPAVQAASIAAAVKRLGRNFNGYFGE